MKHRRFSGDNISCQNLSTGNVVAYYTNKMLPKKLQGILVIEPQVSSQDDFMSDYVIATYAATMLPHKTVVLTSTLHQHCDLCCCFALPFEHCADCTEFSMKYGGKGTLEPDLQQSAVDHSWSLIQVQDMNLLHTLVAGCLSYREWLERRDMLVSTTQSNKMGKLQQMIQHVGYTATSAAAEQTLFPQQQALHHSFAGRWIY